MNGRLTDVLIEDEYYTDPRTGVEKIHEYITVWADAGMKEVIKAVEGVTSVFTTITDTEYSVYLDPRYDREYLKREIEAAIRCAPERTEDDGNE